MLKFIQNIGEYFPSNYFDEDFTSKVIRKSEIDKDECKKIESDIRQLKEKYFRYKRLCRENMRTKDVIFETHAFNSLLLEALGYETQKPYTEPYYLTEDEVLPVRHVYYNNDAPQLLVMEMQPLFADGDTVPDGLFQQCYHSGGEDKQSESQRYHRSQWKRVITDIDQWPSIAPSIINKAVSQLFLQEPHSRPQYILLLSGNRVFFLEQEKWFRGAYLEFDLEELFTEGAVQPACYSAFYALMSYNSLASGSKQVLIQSIEEEAHKSAYEVTKDLKEGIIGAVEALANEAVYYKQNCLNEQIDASSESFAAVIKDEALTIVYRLLFIFYAESREDLDILPSANTVYERGYSLEMLRDMEQTPLQSNGAQNGYFFDDSLRTLFGLLSDGYRADERGQLNRSFDVRKIDSPLFNDRRLTVFGKIRIRNIVWQQIICRLSLSKQDRKRKRGRISYANLGINQLGSVYESLLAYRGFYAAEDLMEVYQAGKKEEGTFLVPYVRRSDFKEDEILKDENGKDVILSKGSFVYRLNGRDRTKSASFYTPESLTRATVKYALKGYADRIANKEMRPVELLNLKMLEPAMGAAAFHNEMINQLAELYLITQQKHKNKRIPPEAFREELQRVKAYLATNNVYGVDINPTAVELGKLSLWLNVIHRDMDTPFFGNRLCVGNAVVGAWLKVYTKDQVKGITGRAQKLTPNPWWEKPATPVRFIKTKVKRPQDSVYHFLLPDKQMLAVLGIREQKAAHPDRADRYAELRKQWTAPVTGDELIRLQRISEQVDRLLAEHMQQQLNLQRLTQNRHHVWGTEEHRQGLGSEMFSSYDEKERLFNVRNNRQSAYYKLRTVMDYWCALWYWDFDSAELPPSREAFWGDIEKLLNVKFNADDKACVSEFTPLNVYAQQGDLFAPLSEANEAAGSDVPDEAESPEVISEALFAEQTAEELLAQQHDQSTLFADEGRVAVVQQMRKKYHFFHPQLEFLEVFWLRGGFDLICGNPPWLKLEYNEQDIISEKFPEVAIRKVSAPDVRRMRETLMQDDPLLSELIREEQIENEATKIFLNATVNYPLLRGQQTNLYKCILTNGFELLAPQGYMGLVHPEGIYDDANGQPLRKALYPRLHYHFQFQNQLKLFSDVDHNTAFGIHVYKGNMFLVLFNSIHNLFHPTTIDACFVHNGQGTCEGIKRWDDQKQAYVWNLNGHKERIVQFDERALRTIAKTFEEDADWQSAKLVSIHAEPEMVILEKLAEFSGKIGDFDPIITEGLHEVSSIDKNIMRRETGYPDFTRYEMIYSGPHLFVNNPLYKTPRQLCKLSSDYDTINLTQCDADTEARTNYVPACDLPQYTSLIQGFDQGKPWIDLYKVGFRKMLSQTGERTLTSAILPAKASHIHGVISATFKDVRNLIECAALTSSVLLDFFIKKVGAANLTESRLSAFPLGVNEIYRPALFSRTLQLNCVNKHYAALWSEMWDDTYAADTWTIDDARLSPFSRLTAGWSAACALRNWFERRQAQIEIDVLVAMALGLTPEQLCFIYDIQFPVLQQNEMDTWYDARGQIVFTCSKGLTGVGLDRPVWNSVKKEAEDALSQGKAYTYTHTIAKSELYNGQEQVFEAPFTKCDRKADYRHAWAYFKTRFGV